MTNGGSGYFDGSGDYLRVTTATALQLSNSVAWTIEGWIYTTTVSPSVQFVLDAYKGGSPFNGYAIRLNTSTLQFYDGTTYTNIGTGLTANQWYHFAVSYEGSGTTARVFLNGNQQGSAFTIGSNMNNTSDPLNIGSDEVGTTNFSGWMSSLRLVKGTAVYTAAFTPPTAPWIS